MTHEEREYLRQQRSKLLLERIRSRNHTCGECHMPLDEPTDGCSRCYDRQRRRNQQQRRRQISQEPTGTERRRTARITRHCIGCGQPWNHRTPGCRPCYWRWWDKQKKKAA